MFDAGVYSASTEVRRSLCPRPVCPRLRKSRFFDACGSRNIRCKVVESLTKALKINKTLTKLSSGAFITFPTHSPSSPESIRLLVRSTHLQRYLRPRCRVPVRGSHSQEGTHKDRSHVVEAFSRRPSSPPIGSRRIIRWETQGKKIGDQGDGERRSKSTRPSRNFVSRALISLRARRS